MANKTVYVDGTTSSGHYATLQAAITGEVTANANLVTMAGILHIEVSLTTADTTIADVAGFTTNASYYVNIYTTAGARHDGKWNGAKARMEVSGDVTALRLQSGYTRVTGMQVKVSSSGTGQSPKAIVVDASNCLIDKTICWFSITHSGCGLEMIRSNDTGTLTNVVCFANGAGVATSAWSYGFYTQAGSSLLNCTSHGHKVNFRSTSGTIVLKNCISQASVTTGYDIATSTGSDYNLSDRADAVGTTVYNSKTLTFADAANGDFHLVAGDTDAIDKGTDLSGTFTDDIDGVTRSGTWDVGADEYVAVGGSTFTPQVIMVL